MVYEEQRDQGEGESREESGMGSKGDKVNSTQINGRNRARTRIRASASGQREQMPKRIVVNPIGRFSRRGAVPVDGYR